MKGIHIFHGDYGRGGKDGFVHVVDDWCVQTPQGKKHIIKECTERIEYKITDCDGSCERKEQELPIDIINIAKAVGRNIRDPGGPIRLPEGDGIIDHSGGDPQLPYRVRCP